MWKATGASCPCRPLTTAAAVRGWSPGGASVAFSSELQIYTYDTKLNTTPRQVTFEGNNVSPIFSPDGRRIAFSSSRDGTQGVDLFVKDLTSDSPPRSVLAMEGAQLVTQWPTDTLVLFENRDERGVGELWTLDISDPESPQARPYLSSDADLSDFAVSLSAGLAAYRSVESGTEEVYVRSFPDPGEPTVVSRDGGGIPFWSLDGGTLYYGTRIGRMFVAAALARDPVPRVVSIDTLFGDPGIAVIPAPGATMHPDGDRFIFVVYPDAAGVAGGASEPGQLILVQGFQEELKRLAR